MGKILILFSHPHSKYINSVGLHSNGDLFRLNILINGISKLDVNNHVTLSHMGQ